MICVFPDVPHLYGPEDGEFWQEYFLVFEGPVFDLWRTQGLLDPAEPVLHVEPVEYWLKQMQRVADVTATTEESALVRVARLQELLAELLGAPSAVAALLLMVRAGPEQLAMDQAAVPRRFPGAQPHLRLCCRG